MRSIDHPFGDNNNEWMNVRLSFDGVDEMTMTIPKYCYEDFIDAWRNSRDWEFKITGSRYNVSGITRATHFVRMRDVKRIIV